MTTFFFFLILFILNSSNYFRYALTYILLISIMWLGYFVILGMENNSEFWSVIAVMFGTVATMASAILYFTYTDHYRTFVLPISVGVALMLCFLSILFLVFVPPHTDGLTLVSFSVVEKKGKSKQLVEQKIICKYNR